MIIVGAVPMLGDAIGNLPLQLGIVLQGRDKAGDLLAPRLRRSVLELIFDEKMFHERAPLGSGLSPDDVVGIGVCASMDENDTMEFRPRPPEGATRRWRRGNQRRSLAVPSRRSRK